MAKKENTTLKIYKHVRNLKDINHFQIYLVYTSKLHNLLIKKEYNKHLSLVSIFVIC